MILWGSCMAKGKQVKNIIEIAGKWMSKHLDNHFEISSDTIKRTSRAARKRIEEVGKDLKTQFSGDDLPTFTGNRTYRLNR